MELQCEGVSKSKARIISPALSSSLSDQQSQPTHDLALSKSMGISTMLREYALDFLLQLACEVFLFNLDDVLPWHNDQAQIPVRHLHLDGARGGVGVLGSSSALLDGGLSVLVGVGQHDVAVLVHAKDEKSWLDWA